MYASCIEQFWATAKVITVNREVQLQALVDGKRVIITESIVKRDLRLEDAEGDEGGDGDVATKEEGGVRLWYGSSGGDEVVSSVA
ncbi:hypothetical protein Tco_0183667 [Tanacetum coccineum]